MILFGIGMIVLALWANLGYYKAMNNREPKVISLVGYTGLKPE